MLFHHKDYTQKAIRAGIPPALPAECYLSLPGCLHHTAAAGFLSTSGISACSFRRPEFLVDPPGVEPAHPQHRFCLPIGCGGFPPSVYTHLISELSAYCVGLRQARAFTSPKFFWLHLHSLLVGCAPIYFNVPGALKAGMPPTSHCCATSIRRFQRCLCTAYFLSSGTPSCGRSSSTNFSNLENSSSTFAGLNFPRSSIIYGTYPHFLISSIFRRSLF